MTVSLAAVLGMTGLLAAGGAAWMMVPDASDAPRSVTMVAAPASGGPTSGGNEAGTRPARIELAQAATTPAPQTLPGAPRR